MLHGEQEFSYHRMAYAGDELAARSRITDVYEKKGGALQFLVKETTVTDQDGALVATLRGTTVIRPLPETAPMTSGEAGTELPELAVEPISRTTLALFAGASGDRNPIHIDLDVARSAGLDDVFAHGMLSMAYLGRLLTDAFPQQQLRSWKVRFAAITPVHAQPVCTGQITSIDESAGERLATIDLRVTLADGTQTLAGQAVVALD